MSLACFLSGVYMSTFAASGLIFLKFFRSSGDRFFKIFSFACWSLALERLALLTVAPAVHPPTEAESQSWVYLFRLAAFVMIVFAIFDKNRREGDANK